MTFLESINAEIVACELCPRLVAWRERVGSERRRAYADQRYWARPVPAFGDPDATRLIVGLAPAAHGANRTGAMFHGDRSGEWLFGALHRAGVAKLPYSDIPRQGQRLQGALIAATCHCAPPGNKPTPEELANCSSYLVRILKSREWRSILCLGSISWFGVLRHLGVPRQDFGHAKVVTIGATRIVGSYHPSQQNTFTGRLTEPMLDQAIAIWQGA